ncbi:hypothetical protein GGI15_003207 [Coemansia interrupta]|uniref:Uncharacterized protein n=1 Tax=Coemansia interrupta TaxID=1126814 RepID=A0A9W8HGF8_9FUNG|nr:hypothetical protein GGI15_003207 [Coemansia interrupta]
MLLIKVAVLPIFSALVSANLFNPETVLLRRGQAPAIDREPIINIAPKQALARRAAGVIVVDPIPTTDAQVASIMKQITTSTSESSTSDISTTEEANTQITDSTTADESTSEVADTESYSASTTATDSNTATDSSSTDDSATPTTSSEYTATSSPPATSYSATTSAEHSIYTSTIVVVTGKCVH